MAGLAEHDIADEAQSAAAEQAEACDQTGRKENGVSSSISPNAASVADYAADCAEFSEAEVSFFKEDVTFSDAPAGKDVLFSPGAVFVCCGEFSKGGLINLALSFVFLAFFASFSIFHFFPLPGTLFLLVVVILLWIGFVVTYHDRARKLKTGGRLFHLSFGIVTFWFPLIVSLIFAFGFVMQRTWMSNDRMYPSMKKGDFILVDRLSYWTRTPSRGDVVLIESVLDDGSARGLRRSFFARIIAVPGDAFQLRSGVAYVNEAPLSIYFPHDSIRKFAQQKTLIAYESPYGVPPVDPERGEVPEKWYPVQYSSQMLFTQTEVVRLKPDQYFVIEDNRDDSDLRYIKKSFGSIVHVSSIKGQPLFVIYNSVDGSGFDRYGLRLQ